MTIEKLRDQFEEVVSTIREDYKLRWHDTDEQPGAYMKEEVQTLWELVNRYDNSAALVITPDPEHAAESVQFEIQLGSQVPMSKNLQALLGMLQNMLSSDEALLAAATAIAQQRERPTVH